MRTILDALDRLPRDGWALARVTDVIDRAPLRAGDAIAVRDDDAVIGSLACGAEHVRAELAADRAAVLETLLPDSEDVFVQRFLPRPQMVLVGATQFARALSSVGRLLGYRVTVCDARAPFADPAAFPEADEVVVGWGEDVIRNCGLDERAAVCFLAHDRRSDVAALAAALGTPAGYIGALGTRATQADRRQRLLRLGVREEDIARIAAPIGLHLGAVDPEEVAVAIAAEIVQLKRHGRAARLSETTGPLHDREIVVDSGRGRAAKLTRAGSTTSHPE